MQIEGRGYIYHNAQVTYPALAELLTPALRWAYVETLFSAAFHVCQADLLHTWPHGRAFGATQSTFAAETPIGFEVRWQASAVDASLYQVDVLTEDPQWQPPDSKWQRVAPDIDGLHYREILLWGEMGKSPSADPTWIEIRIPHPLKYPVTTTHPPNPEKTPLQLRVMLLGYDYTVKGSSVATRWAWLRQGSES